MFDSVTSIALVGVEPRPVNVEAHIGSRANESFVIVGLPDVAVREARERVRSAMQISGYEFPNRRVVVNLSPADLPKGGSAYDLPIALAILAAARLIPAEAAKVVALGELALDGSVRAVRGALGAAVAARRLGRMCLVPGSSVGEAVAIDDVDVYPVDTLNSAIQAALGNPTAAAPGVSAHEAASGPDLAGVRGQAAARRALEVAAAGGHHLLMVGAPGSGKTMMARCLPGILPPLAVEDRLEVSLAWAAAGRPRGQSDSPPYRSPHHSATLAAMIGGGSGVPQPGEVTLAHRGVLFLDELGEFPTHILDALRQPVEEGWVTVSRRGASVRFPSSFQLVAATNPCPCGFEGDRLVACRCNARAVARYASRLSGPLLDRFDLRVTVARLDAEELTGPASEGSNEVRARVTAARKRQLERGILNRELTGHQLDELDWDPAAQRMLTRSVTTLALTARGWDRTRRVAVTIADLDESTILGERHMAEALAYRGTT